MDYKELMHKGNSGELRFDEVIEYFGERFKPQIELLHKRVGKIDNLVYLLAVAQHYEDKKAPLELLIKKTPPHGGMEGFDFKAFYNQQKFLYCVESKGMLNREKVEELIGYNLGFDVRGSTGFATRDPSYKNNNDGSFDNTIKLLEDGHED